MHDERHERGRTSKCACMLVISLVEELGIKLVGYAPLLVFPTVKCVPMAKQSTSGAGL